MNEPIAITRSLTGSRARRGPTREPGEEKLGDRLYSQIFERIAAGEFPPESRLPSEATLANRFAVSRPVVREALARLRDHGLIHSRQGSGSYVRRRPDQAVLSFAPVGSVADIQRCFEFRAAFEGRAAALAAERHDQTSLAPIEEALTSLDEVVGTPELGVDADYRLHLAVASAARNHFFAATLAMLEGQIRTAMNVARNLSLRRPTARQQLIQEEHRGVVEAIRVRDAAAAERLMSEHIENARRRVFDGDGG